MTATVTCIAVRPNLETPFYHETPECVTLFPAAVAAARANRTVVTMSEDGLTRTWVETFPDMFAFEAASEALYTEWPTFREDRNAYCAANGITLTWDLNLG